MWKCLLFLAAIVAGEVLIAGEVQNDVTIATATGPYQALERYEIVELGDKHGSSVPPGEHHETRKLTHGLNWLASSGWELIAIDPGRTVPITGPAGSTRSYQPMYIFRKKK